MELGWSFWWKGFSRPVVTLPDGRELPLEVVDYVPLLESTAFACKRDDSYNVGRQFSMIAQARRALAGTSVEALPSNPSGSAASSSGSAPAPGAVPPSDGAVPGGEAAPAASDADDDDIPMSHFFTHFLSILDALLASGPAYVEGLSGTRR